MLMTLVIGCCLGCGSPSAIGPEPDLTIYPPTTSLRVDEVVQFVASVSGAIVPATWTSSAPAVIALDKTGAATGIAPGTGSVTAAAANAVATRTLQVVSDYRGQYSGEAIVTRCVRLSGDGPRSSCVAGAIFAINALTLDRQTGVSVLGSLDVFGESTTGSVVGTIDQNDHLGSMSGTLMSSGEDAVVLKIERWDTTLTDGGRQMVGSFGGDLQFRNGFGPQHQDIDFSLNGVVRRH